jgi:hypothetical protein
MSSVRNEVIVMSRELVIPTDDPNTMKAFDPYSVQGMINALAFFAREHGHDMRRDYNAFIVDMEDNMIVLVPTESGLATKHIRVDSKLAPRGRGEMAMVSEMSIFNPDKIEYDEGGPIKFFARDPSAILTIEAGPDSTIQTALTATDVRHPDRIHGALVRYVI